MAVGEVSHGLAARRFGIRGTREPVRTASQRSEAPLQDALEDRCWRLFRHHSRLETLDAHGGVAETLRQAILEVGAGSSWAVGSLQAQVSGWMLDHFRATAARGDRVTAKEALRARLAHPRGPPLALRKVPPERHHRARTPRPESGRCVRLAASGYSGLAPERRTSSAYFGSSAA